MSEKSPDISTPFDGQIDRKKKDEKVPEESPDVSGKNDENVSEKYWRPKKDENMTEESPEDHDSAQRKRLDFLPGGKYQGNFHGAY